MSEIRAHPQAAYPALPVLQDPDLAAVAQAYERVKETLETLTRQNRRNEQSALTVRDLPEISAGVLNFYSTLSVSGASPAPLITASRVTYDHLGSKLAATDVQAAIDELAFLSTVAKEPTGFPTPDDSTIEIDEALRTFSISPTGGSFDYFLSGRKKTVSTPQTVVWDDLEGIHWIYFDKDGSGLVATQTFSLEIIEQHCMVAMIYWDATNGEAIRFGDERHGLVMDGLTHTHFHLTILG